METQQKCLNRRQGTSFNNVSTWLLARRLMCVTMRSHPPLVAWMTLNLFLSRVGGGGAANSECVCDGASCTGGGRCWGQQCFTSLSVLNGTQVVQKGCAVGNETGSLLCGSRPTPERVVECCAGDLCNHNVSLQPPQVRGNSIYC